MRKTKDIIINGSPLNDLLARGGNLDLSSINLRRTNLRGADLRRTNLFKADLCGADLNDADLSGADLSGADLNDADLSGADLNDADLSGADLSGANLSGANLRGADLNDANLSNANLHRANLSDAHLRRTNLFKADLQRADLCGADLNDADLSGADLSGADLNNTNLSGAKGLIDPTRWMAEHFETDDLGYIVYKAIGNDTPYANKLPAHWQCVPGAFLEETVNLLPTTVCGCGISFATLPWLQNKYLQAIIWRCRIRWVDLPGVVVPYNTDGKARCGRLELISLQKTEGENV